jgi:hypothetical protein
MNYYIYTYKIINFEKSDISVTKYSSIESLRDSQIIYRFLCSTDDPVKFFLDIIYDMKNNFVYKNSYYVISAALESQICFEIFNDKTPKSLLTTECIRKLRNIKINILLNK